MTDHIPHANSSPDKNNDFGPPPGAPRWVKVLGIIFITAVLIFVILHLTGGGFKGHG